MVDTSAWPNHIPTPYAFRCNYHFSKNRGGSGWQNNVNASVIRSGGSGGCNRGMKRRSVVNMSSSICSRKKDAVDGRRGGDNSRKRSGNSIPRLRR